MNRDRRDERWVRALEGGLPDEEWEAFQRDTLDDPAALEAFAAESWIRGNLQAFADELPGHFEKHPLPGEERSPAIRGGLFPSILSTVAAAASAALLTWWLIPEPDPTVATLVEADGCRWSGSELPTTEGARLPPGKLSLIGGMATLEFDSGARVIIEAPTTLEVRSDMECRLISGSLVGEVPESAHGFTVWAPDLEIVDLGTRFGVTSNQFGKSHVMVFDGEVEVTKSGETLATSLTEGKSMVNGSRVALPKEEVDRSVPLPPRGREGWILFESTRDSFVRKGHGNFGDSPLMMVKETPLSPNNRRRGILSFDLTGLDPDSIEAAEFVLNVESSGLGFSTLIPDSRFAVHAIIDDRLDDWEEHQVTWETLPAVDEAGPRLEITRKLGTFEIRRGASASSSVSVSSPELVALLREDANRLVTFLIVRETGEYESQGLVHAFATREHPVSRAPALNIRLRQ